ncbi:MAG: signal recognition particle-docking protein FtsY [Pirellulaceae bacterium]|jgi:fused signal recognition particle receptor|nr:signal recognition particle-docking protein FtsY [Pirellulaceae bacterium]MDP7014933.1 signal recognition particle-docking protein FtsY [Pirellulaceae bacterium]
MGLLDRFRKEDAADTDSAAGAADAPAEAPSTGESDEPAKRGLFARLRSGLQKTSDLLRTDVRDLLKKEGDIVDDAFLTRLYAILVKTDMGNAAATAIRDEVLARHRARKVHMEEILATIRDKFRELLAQAPGGDAESPLELAPSAPTVVVVVGVNGSGKTTSIAKLTNLFVKQGKKVVLGAGDTFRAAAVEQLTIWADRLDCEIVKAEQGSDPASVAHRAVAVACETGADICIVDTAGRLQTQSNLMDQLTKIRRVMSKQVAEAPHEVLLVLDATAGQNAISQARGFSDAANCTGIILAKLDGTAKGGVIIPIRQQFDLPVKYVGLGETADDLDVFNVDRFLDALFD